MIYVNSREAALPVFVNGLQMCQIEAKILPTHWSMPATPACTAPARCSSRTDREDDRCNASGRRKLRQRLLLLVLLLRCHHHIASTRLRLLRGSAQAWPGAQRGLAGCEHAELLRLDSCPTSSVLRWAIDNVSACVPSCRQSQTQDEIECRHCSCSRQSSNEVQSHYGPLEMLSRSRTDEVLNRGHLWLFVTWRDDLECQAVLVTILALSETLGEFSAF